MEYTEYSGNPNYAVNRQSLLADFYGDEAVPIESRIRLGYGNSAEEYLKSGDRDTRLMVQVLEQHGVRLEPRAACLDFGCGGGRMLRHLPNFVPDGEFWGCDSESRAIAWAQTYLSKQLRLFTNLREPHLPFEDHTFDFIYAGSVFSHLHDMAEFWMLELRRIVKPKTGVLYLTFQDESSLQTIRRQASAGSKYYYDKLFSAPEIENLFASDYRRIVINRDKYSSQVFYKTAELEGLLKQFFCWVKLHPGGYGWQTAAILRK